MVYVSYCVGLKLVPIHREITESALKVLCNVVSHDTFHSVVTRGSVSHTVFMIDVKHTGILRFLILSHFLHFKNFLVHM